MKKILIILCLCTIHGLAKKPPVYPNLSPLPHIIDAKWFPGCKPVLGDYLYMSHTEVSNDSYLEYLYWLKMHQPAAVVSQLPDTLVWRDKYAFNEPFINYYLRHPGYQDYPVVGVSQQQARSFCFWLHERLDEYYKINNIPIEEFIVRLPTEKEWMMAARGGLPETAIYPWPGSSTRIQKGQSKKRDEGFLWFNFKRGSGDPAGMPGRLNDQGFIPMPIESYWPNGYGLYHMAGNVSEWIHESGKTKGGCWNLPGYNARIDVPGYWDGDSSGKSTIGFRYVIEVVSVKSVFTPLTLTKKYFSSILAPIPKDSLQQKTLFASVSEVSNLEYRCFLVENNSEIYKLHSANWQHYFPYRYYEMYGRHAAYGNYPVVNISYEAAQAYCKWLTDKYHSIPDRPYKKVLFRLPAEKEWEYAATAHGSKYTWPYPWGGPYERNSKGAYLANFCPREDQYLYKRDGKYWYNYPDGDYSISRSVDGHIIPAEARSYFPNKNGLYNCSGNVAEMIDRKGISKGGSWNSANEFILISSHENYTSASAELGFRVFMEVLE